MINAKRSPTPPPSLAAKKSYSEPDVIAALQADFLGKCYLCEIELPVRVLSVDHRKQQEHFPELKYAWPNLFPACRDCNERRRRRPPEHDLLDPAGDDVEARLQQTMRPVDLFEGERPDFTAVATDDFCAIATARELDYIHNARSLKAAELRSVIRDRVDEVLGLLLELQAHAGVAGPVRKVLEEPARLAFSRRAPFTALIRGRLGAGFEHLFD